LTLLRDRLAFMPGNRLAYKLLVLALGLVSPFGLLWFAMDCFGLLWVALDYLLNSA